MQGGSRKSLSLARAQQGSPSPRGALSDRARPILHISETRILILTKGVKLMICSSAKKGSNRTRTALNRTESH